MKIKAFVDGVEREVDLLGMQINEAYEKTQKEIDIEDVRYYIEENFDILGYDGKTINRILDNVETVAQEYRNFADGEWCDNMRLGIEYFLDEY